MADVISIANGQDMAEIMAKINALQAENERLKAKAAAAASRKISLKVSDKGALSLYGLGRFPVTLYRGQWERLLSEKQAILDFISDNSAALSVKE